MRIIHNTRQQTYPDNKNYNSERNGGGTNITNTHPSSATWSTAAMATKSFALVANERRQCTASTKKGPNIGKYWSCCKRDTDTHRALTLNNHCYDRIRCTLRTDSAIDNNQWLTRP